MISRSSLDLDYQMEGHTLLAGLAELGRGAHAANARAALSSYGGE